MKSDWISVKIEPEFDGPYLVLTNERQECGVIRQFHRVAFNHHNNWITGTDEYITHWMHLPEPPKE